MLDNILSDQKITQDEGKQLFGNDAASAALLAMPPEQLDTVVANSADADPEFRQNLYDVAGAIGTWKESFVPGRLKAKGLSDEQIPVFIAAAQRYAAARPASP